MKWQETALLCDGLRSGLGQRVVQCYQKKRLNAVAHNQSKIATATMMRLVAEHFPVAKKIHSKPQMHG